MLLKSHQRSGILRTDNQVDSEQVTDIFNKSIVTNWFIRTLISSEGIGSNSSSSHHEISIGTRFTGGSFLIVG
jgi:hypothetical protein